MRVLLVEDFQPLVRALKLGLGEEGWVVDAVRASADGFEKALQEPYDIILLDMKTSPDAGFRLLRSWREAGLTTHVLALTAPGQVFDKVRSLDLGADDCLTKPFAFEELLARMRALMRRRSNPGEAVVHIGDLEINPTFRTVKRSGQAIYLTAREFDLLHLLASHCGRVVSRSVIWQHLYDEQIEKSSNVIEVYIRYLRKKIDMGFPHPLIQTRRGEGYMLASEER
jgi:DNA-binding response OmpR family regulator